MTDIHMDMADMSNPGSFASSSRNYSSSSSSSNPVSQYGSNLKDGDKKTWGITLAVVAGLGLIAMIIALAVVLSRSASFGLPPTRAGELSHALCSSDPYPNGKPRVVARSYDGLEWEPIVQSDSVPVDVVCSSPSSCSITTPGSYFVQQLDVPPGLINVTQDELAFRLLTQATFGGTAAEIQAVASTYGSPATTRAAGRASLNVTRWLLDQMALPKTLHRQYYRERTHPRLLNPDLIGTAVKPCSVGSRWTRYAFYVEDEFRLMSITVSGDKFQLILGGVVFTEVSTFLGFTPAGGGAPNQARICSVINPTPGTGGTITWEGVDAPMLVSINEAEAFNCTPANLMLSSNPAVSFTSVPANAKVFAAGEVTLQPLPATINPDVSILTAITVPCTSDPAYIQVGGVYYRRDPRAALLRNTVESPADTTTSLGTCPAVLPSFVNQAQCVRRVSCSPLVTTSKAYTLDTTGVRNFFTVGPGHYVYVVQGLRLETPFAVSPCGRTSRWIRSTGNCAVDTVLSDPTKATLIAGISALSDPDIRDVTLAPDVAPAVTCDATIVAAIGAKFSIDGNCWTNVHPDELSVRDFDYWSVAHDGNEAVQMMGRPNPITEPAILGNHIFNFPASHSMQRWQDRRALIPTIGRFGETIDFAGLPTSLQTPAMVALAGASQSASTESFQACGSHGEAANIASNPHTYYLPGAAVDSIERRTLDFPHDINNGKTQLFLNVVLKAPDQLCQRVAWWLAQTFVVSAQTLGWEESTEIWAYLHDTFVRHCFGNYFDVMKEISYSPMMGDYLSFRGNQAFGFAQNAPDENYAREVMQLFSIGLCLLNDDGTAMPNPNAPNPRRQSCIDTYTIRDIPEMARLWTGFDRASIRANINDPSGAYTANMIDPMKLTPLWRDVQPKIKLNEGYLGDHLPLCDDLPYPAWLNEGATFTYTGSSSIEGKILDAGGPPAEAGLRPRFNVAPPSQLYARLCAADGSGRCTFPDKVVLTETLPCNGLECLAGRVLSVQLTDPVAGVTRYYTYDSVPCVRLSFFAAGKKIKNGNNVQCADPSWAVGYPTCCTGAARTTRSGNYSSECLFVNEATTWTTAKQRCESSGRSLCVDTAGLWNDWSKTCASGVYQWADGACSLQVQVFPNGQVTTVDSTVSAAQKFRVVTVNSGNTYRVYWQGTGNQTFPVPDATNSCPVGCTNQAHPTQGNTCVCTVEVEEAVPYRVLEDLPSYVENIARTLHIGAPKPASFPKLEGGTPAYERCVNVTCNATRYTNIEIWLKSSGGNSNFDRDTIFVLPPVRLGGKPRIVFNRNSTVKAGGKAFRNPPSHMNFIGQQMNLAQEWTSQNFWINEAAHEVDVLLTHLFEHNNTAVLFCLKLFQQFVSSNPSGKAMRACVNAFRTGAVEGSNLTFSGRYGDMGAAVAAVLLHPEARNTIVEADPLFGLFHDPFAKLMRFIRSMRLTGRWAADGQELQMVGLVDRLAVEPYNAPNVFSFFQPNFAPPGNVSERSQRAPQFQTFVGPLVLSTMNGMHSTIDTGLTSCNDGFGWSQVSPRRVPLTTNGYRPCGTSQLLNTRDGSLAETAPGTTPREIIDHFNLLLTGRRLNETTVALFVEKFEDSIARGSTVATATNLILKLITASPEFHTNGANLISDIPRPVPVPPVSQGRAYKATIVILLAGGQDSANMLVPLSGCSAGDLYAQYATVRQGAAVASANLLPISVPAGTQPCNTFGVNPGLPHIKSLYDAGQAAFFANLGTLCDPVTKDDWKSRKSGKCFPNSLFAHNTQQQANQNLWAQNDAANGILGRIADALSNSSAPNPYAVSLFSLNGLAKAVESDFVSPVVVDPYSGVVQLKQYSTLKLSLNSMTDRYSTNQIANTYGQTLRDALDVSTGLGGLLSTTVTTTVFPTTGIGRSLGRVAQVIKTRQTRATERDLFYAVLNGWDTHNTFATQPLYQQLNDAIQALSTELKLQGEWDNTAVMVVTDFGRTFTSNGQGTDHAWGYNTFIAGGRVNGGRVFGSYPTDVTDAGPQSIGNGRLLPTTPLEAPWQAIAQWNGVPPSSMARVLPNAARFPSEMLFTNDTLFK